MALDYTPGRARDRFVKRPTPLKDIIRRLLSGPRGASPAFANNTFSVRVEKRQKYQNKNTIARDLSLQRPYMFFGDFAYLPNLEHNVPLFSFGFKPLWTRWLIWLLYIYIYQSTRCEISFCSSCFRYISVIHVYRDIPRFSEISDYVKFAMFLKIIAPNDLCQWRNYLWQYSAYVFFPYNFIVIV